MSIWCRLVNADVSSLLQVSLVSVKAVNTSVAVVVFVVNAVVATVVAGSTLKASNSMELKTNLEFN